MTGLPLEHIIEWDVPNWSNVLGFWQEVLPVNNDNLKILLLGERNGGLTLWMALLGYRVVSSDYDGITQDGKDLHRYYGVTHLIEYRNIDIFSIPYDNETFDIVMCKSVIGGLKAIKTDRSTRNLQNQANAVEEVRRVLKKDGYFLGAENLRGSQIHNIVRKVTGKNKGWRYMTTDDLKYCFKDYSELNLKTYGFLGAFFKHKILNQMAAGIDRILNSFLPENSKYIAFIIARK